MNIAYIGLGSNLAKPEKNITDAIQHIDNKDEINIKVVSSFYQTAPIGEVAQDDFINAVLALETSLEPEPLLDILQQIEAVFGRKRTIRWGPRTLDLDILLFNQQQINSSRLTVPHPEMYRRGFVLIPLAEIAPEARIPGFSQSVAELAQITDHTGVRKLEMAQIGKSE